MNRENDDAGATYGGHDLETGMLARVRQWADLWSWIRLGRCLRIVASIPSLVTTAVALLVTSLVNQVFLGRDGLPARGGLGQSWSSAAWDVLRDSGDQFLSVAPPSIFWPVSGVGFAFQSAHLIVAVVVWTPVAIWLTRQGGLLTAGRPMTGVAVGLRHAVRRTPAAWVAAIIALACMLLLGVLVLAIASLGRLGFGVELIEVAIGAVASLAAIAAGLLGFGGFIAVPLSWSAIANEEEVDPLNSLSRGYEYFFRRPLQWVAYLVISLGMLIVVAGLSVGLAQTALAISETLFGFVAVPAQVAGSLAACLAALPMVVCTTLAWTLLGGVYLLLRADANHQEVEDLWVPRSIDPTADLPTLGASSHSD